MPEDLPGEPSGERMIALAKIRNLDLSAAASTGRPLHLSAASGLVRLKSFLYVVADDELHLGVFGAENDEPGHLLRLFEGELPGPKPERKKKKPDLEALVLLPAFAEHAHGALLALGSGSKRTRRLGALVTLNARGAVHGSPRVVDLSPILAPLEDAFAKPNIEGAVVSSDELRLFQRGNKGNAVNAIIRFDLRALLHMLREERPSAIKPSTIDLFDLGTIEGIPLCFTDAAALPNGDMVFSAVAEDTDNAYDDGPSAGTVIGLVANDGSLRWQRSIDRRCKVEGVDARLDGDLIKLLLVTDADDPDVPAGLYAATTRERL